MADGIGGTVSDIGKDFLKEGKLQVAGSIKPVVGSSNPSPVTDPAVLQAAVLPKEEKNIALQKQIIEQAVDKERLKRDQREQQYQQTQVTSQSQPETDLQNQQAGGMSADRILQVIGKRGEMKGNKSGE